MTADNILHELGLSEKEVKVYRALLQSGPASVRKIASAADINRGTTYDILKSLKEQGIVSYYHQDKHQFFTAENPRKLKEYLAARIRALEATKNDLESVIPELQSLYDRADTKPTVKYYDGFAGIKSMLIDVLDTMGREKMPRLYFVYSSANIREYLYKDFPDFNRERIKKNIAVRTIALGPGGKTHGLDERKWLRTPAGSSPTYTILYSTKTAYISVNQAGSPFGTIIKDASVAETQQLIFHHLWETL